MKYLHTFTICLLSIYLFGQTTQEEYNYVTKGYKIQIESGLDMKKGYEFKDLDTWGLNYNNKFKRNVTYKHLYRIGDPIPCATLMIFDRTDTTYKEYLCIPHYDSPKEMWDETLVRFKVAAKEWTNPSIGYSWGMIKMISYMSSQKDRQ